MAKYRIMTYCWRCWRCWRWLTIPDLIYHPSKTPPTLGLAFFWRHFLALIMQHLTSRRSLNSKVIAEREYNRVVVGGGTVPLPLLTRS